MRRYVPGPDSCTAARTIPTRSPRRQSQAASWVCRDRSSHGCGPHGAAVSSLTSCVMTSGRNFEAKPSTKFLLANTPAQCFRRSASSSNFQRWTSWLIVPVSALGVAHEILVMAALLERREADLLVELRRFRHLADVECVRSRFVQHHQGFSFIDL